MESEEIVIFDHSEVDSNDDDQNLETYQKEESEVFVNVEHRQAMEKLSSWSDICRVCANSNDHIIPIFEAEGAQHDLSDKIHKYLPIRVAKTDTLPVQLCYHCAATILAWHELLEGCVNAQRQLLQMQSDHSYKEQNNMKCSENSSKELVDDLGSMPLTKQELCMMDQQEEELEQSIVEEESTSRSHIEFYVKKDDTLIKRIDESNDGPVESTRCDKCDKSFSEIPQLVEHLRIEHDDDHVYYCHCCENLFRGPEEIFYEHIRDHEREHEAINNEKSDNLLHSSSEIFAKTKICKDAPTSMEDDDDSSVPERVTTFESPKTKTSYMCEFCGKTYNSLLNLRTHQINVHAGLKLFMCDFCERNLASESALENHRRSHTKESPYQCEYCDKKFRTANSMYAHQRIHEDRKPYVCTKCDERYLTKKCLTEHLRKHGESTSYICETCGKSFAVKRNFLRHCRVHSVDEIFVCPYCPSKFRQKRYLRVHTQIHHPGE
ncbi:zinc finger protein 271-like isoform X2 [Venturia canescens]|uniref:zinc finger protein 271-like isoform X2 n=1 Tax=Venturia canescens TaxID=32260 RepID=UPI001C9BF552|nr:zinc finger protein 271-like isoform X2 [Venturia canescens]